MLYYIFIVFWNTDTVTLIYTIKITYIYIYKMCTMSLHYLLLGWANVPKWLQNTELLNPKDQSHFHVEFPCQGTPKLWKQSEQAHADRKRNCFQSQVAKPEWLEHFSTWEDEPDGGPWSKPIQGCCEWTFHWVGIPKCRGARSFPGSSCIWAATTGGCSSWAFASKRGWGFRSWFEFKTWVKSSQETFDCPPSEQLWPRNQA